MSCSGIAQVHGHHAVNFNFSLAICKAVFFFFPFRILMHMSNFNFQVHMTISKSDIQCRQTVHL